MNNSGSILLAYASRYGSTQEVAQAIAAALREEGLQVDLRPMREVVAFEGCGAVVLGAALYNARWHPEAHAFLNAHQGELSRRTVALFALGPLSTSAAAMVRSRRQLEKELEPYAWLKPVALEMFVGKIDPTRLGFFDRLGISASDKRDWGAIRSWARTLAAQLGQPLPLSAPA